MVDELIKQQSPEGFIELVATICPVEHSLCAGVYVHELSHSRIKCVCECHSREVVKRGSLATVQPEGEDD